MRINVKSFFKEFWITLKKSVIAFIDDNAIKLSASLAYYTIFSMAPIIIIIVTLAGYFLGREAIQGEIYGQISGLVGSQAAIQIQEIIKNVNLSKDNVLATIFGVVTLIIGATGTFSEIQDSINSIWEIKAKPKRGFLKLILNRFISFSMIVTIGFLLLVSLIINSILDLLSARLQIYFSNITVVVMYLFNFILIFSVITTLFTIIFKVLPDGRVHWKDALKGASFTALLFMLGKFAISAYLSNSAMTSVYGAAGSIILILLWVYYSSFILFLGAEFTKIYAQNFGHKIIPNDYAVKIIKKEIEKEPKQVAV